MTDSQRFTARRTPFVVASVLAIGLGTLAAAQESKETTEEQKDAVRISLPGGETTLSSVDLSPKFVVSGSAVLTRTSVGSSTKTASAGGGGGTMKLATVSSGGGGSATSTTTTSEGGSSSSTTRPRAVKGDGPTRPRSLGDGWLPNPDGSGGTTLGGSGQPAPTPGTFAVLQPGTGFSGPTAQPSPVGDSSQPGYSAKAIARWDVVPHQTITGQFHIGVVAFHINGIDRVEFSLEGGPWIPVHEMQLNPRTRAWEYTAIVDASTLRDGAFEVRAIVWPNVGRPRVLAGASTETSRKLGEVSLRLTANSGGTMPTAVSYVSPSGSDSSGNGTAQSPYGSILFAAQRMGSAVNGGTIYLLAGDHPLSGASGAPPVTTDRWLTITAAPGLTRDQVRVIGGTAQRLNISRIHLKGVTLPGGITSDTNLNQEPGVWFDDCVLTSYNQIGTTNWASSAVWEGGVYLTDSLIRQTMNGPAHGLIIRNTAAEQLGSDAYQNVYLLVNSTVDGIDRLGTTAHPDIIQWYPGGATINNIIVYGLNAINCRAQGLFAKDGPLMNDVAIVNCVVEIDHNVLQSQWHIPTNHLLFWHLTHVGTQMAFRTSTFTNVSVKNCVFSRLSGGDESFFDNCHFVESGARGTNSTTGDAGWVSQANNDFRPTTSSPLRGRVGVAFVPVDVNNTPIPDTTGSIGALQP